MEYPLYETNGEEDVQKAIAALRDICVKARLKEYGLFILADLPVKTGAIRNMTDSDYWKAAHVLRYAEILGVSAEEVLGKKPCRSTERDFGEIFLTNFQEALEDAGVDMVEVINLFAHMVNRVPSNVKKSLIQGKVMPSLDDSRRLMALTGFRMKDLLDWTGESIGCELRPSMLEAALLDKTRTGWKSAPALAQNMKLLCKESNISPTNLLWCLGVEDSKRRRTILRCRTVPPILLEECAAALHIDGAILAEEDLTKNRLQLSPRPDIGRAICDALRTIISNSGMQESEVCALANMTPCVPPGMSPAVLHERLEWPYTMMVSANEAYLLSLLAALQIPSMSALYQMRAECGATSCYMSVEVKPSGSTRQEASEGCMDVEERDAPAVIPDGVSFASALQVNLQCVRPGKRKWTPESLARATKTLLPKDIVAFLDGKVLPKWQYQVDELVQAFYPEAEKETMEKYRSRFFSSGAALIPNRQAADTYKHGVPPECGAVFSTRLRRLLREKGLNITSLASRLARLERCGEQSVPGSVSNLKGITSKLEKWKWNLSPDEGIDGEDLQGLATILEVPEAELVSLPACGPNASVVRNQLKEILKSINQEEVIMLYYQLWLGGMVNTIE